MFKLLTKKIEQYFSKIKIRTLFVIIAVLFGVAIICLFAASKYELIYKTVYQERVEKLKYIADFSLEVLKDENDAFLLKKKTLKQAQDEAIGILKDVRIENHDYIWIHSFDGTILYHPIKKVIGTNTLALVDFKGYNYGKDLVQEPQKHGFAYVKYYWPKPGDKSEKVYPKVSYVVSFEPWKWIIGTGIYTDDIRAKVLKILFKASLQVISVFLLVILLFRYIILITVIKPIEDLAEKSLKLANNDLSITILENKNNTELGKLYRGFNEFVKVYKENQDKENKLSLILNNITDVILTLDKNGNIQSTNPVIEKMFGYSEKEAVGISINKLTSPEIFSNNTHIGKYEALGIKKNGESFNIEVNVNEIVHDNNELFILLIRDITEQKEVEKIKNEFVSVVSHELRTPLTSIRGSLGLLLSAAFPSITGKVRDLIDIAHNNSLRLINLINDILDIEKIAAGKMEFKYENANVLKLTEDIVSINNPYAERFNVHYKICNNVPEQTEISVDKNRFTQVITNLLSNAAKFSPEKENVNINIEYADGNQDTVRISITDKGPGIPDNFRDKIFSKFTQADSSDKRKKGGTGLGLNICKSLVEQMNGKIDFESEVGKGTTFYVDFSIITK